MYPAEQEPLVAYFNHYEIKIIYKILSPYLFIIELLNRWLQDGINAYRWTVPTIWLPFIPYNESNFLDWLGFRSEDVMERRICDATITEHFKTYFYGDMASSTPTGMA